MMNRETMLQQLNTVTEWDVVIIGGGATGLGAALDAASRNYTTLLIEQSDFAKGTSGRSTKLVHGGVRYLAQGNIKLVMEALHERGYLLKNAPHVTRILEFVVPAYSFYDKYFYGLGLKMYDLLAGKLSVGKTRLLNKKQTLDALPGITSNKLKGGILYYDGQFDDAALALELTKAAHRCKATVLNYCKATALHKEKGRLTGLTFTDTLTNTSYTVKAKSVINATGVFVDAILQMDEPQGQPVVAPSQGIHLVVEKHFFPGSRALMIPKTTDGRVLFAVPWHNQVVLGTTDTAVDDISLEPQALEIEIEFILDNINQFIEKKIKRGDIKSIFAGLRPLVKKGASKKTAMLSRDHTIMVAGSGLITITGGKWTTYRKMAEDVVNQAAIQAQLEPRACTTKQLSLINGHTLLNFPRTAAFGFSKDDVKRYVTEEMARTVEDVLARRTRLLLLDSAAAMAMAPAVATLMAEFLNKDAAWINNQVNDFKETCAHYSQQIPSPNKQIVT